MSTIIQGYQLRTLLFGDLVEKTSQALPNDTTANLYTVAGGNVLVTSMFGEVTTAASSTATTVSLGLAPTTGTPEHAGIASAGSITSAEVGTWVAPAPSSGIAGTLAVGLRAGSALFNSFPFVAPPGTITWTTNANNGAGNGTFNWYLTYTPLDNGASVS